MSKARSLDYVCEACNSIFGSLFELAEHGNLHTGNKPFACTMCMQKFQFTRDYTDHFLEKHTHNYYDLRRGLSRDMHSYQENNYSCNKETTVEEADVFQKISSNSNLTNIEEDGENTTKFPEETIEFNNSDEEVTSITEKNKLFSNVKQKKLLCSCSVYFETFSAYRKHTGPSPYTCCTCQMKFPSVSNLIKHNRCHTKEKPYVCKICNRAFSQTANLKNHESIHNEAVKCKLCSFSCQTPGGMFKHMRKHERGEPIEDQRKFSTKIYECNECGKTFRFSRNLVMHFKSHEGAPFLCSFCGEVFNTRARISRHIRSLHREVGACPVCSKVFKEGPQLAAHVKSHSQQKEYICPVCGKSFTMRSYLTRHLRIHEEPREKNYSCDNCGKQFKGPGGLRYHLKIFKCALRLSQESLEYLNHPTTISHLPNT